MPVKPVPEGYHTVTPYLVVDGAAAAIDFYERAFGAREIMRLPGPPGKIAHAELRIGDSTIMLGDEMPGNLSSPGTLGGSPMGLFLYVEDVDALYQQAVAAGAKIGMEPADMFWGDRYGKLTDPFGHNWSIGTHKEDVAPEEMERRMREATAKMTPQPVA